MVKKRDQPKKFDWLRCPACNSKQVLFVKREEKYWCRICGTTFLVNMEKKHTYIPRKH